MLTFDVLGGWMIVNDWIMAWNLTYHRMVVEQRRYDVATGRLKERYEGGQHLTTDAGDGVNNASGDGIKDKADVVLKEEVEDEAGNSTKDEEENEARHDGGL